MGKSLVSCFFETQCTPSYAFHVRRPVKTHSFLVIANLQKCVGDDGERPICGEISNAKYVDAPLVNVLNALQHVLQRFIIIIDI